MKTVFTSHAKVIHAWIYGDEDFTGRASRVFGRGNELYSYGHHFVLAKKVIRKGKTTIFVNNSTYSSSTTKHQSLVRQAIPYDWEVIYVDDPSASLQSNVLVCLINLKQVLVLASKARSRKSWYLACANGHRDRIHSLQAFGLKKDIKLTASDKRLIAEPFSLSSFVVDTAEYLKQEKRNEAKKLRNRKKADAARAIKHEQSKQKWLAGEIHYFGYTWNEDVLIRFNEDLGVIQTSGGVSITPDEVKELYRRLVAGEDVIGLKIEPYTVLAIDTKIITIGCHKIPLKSVFKLGKEIWMS